MTSKNYKQLHWRLMHHYIIHMVLVIILIHLGHHIISMMIIMVVITITTVVIVIDHSHHHLIVIILIIDFNLAIDSISNVLHHHFNRPQQFNREALFNQRDNMGYAPMDTSNNITQQ